MVKIKLKDIKVQGIIPNSKGRFRAFRLEIVKNLGIKNQSIITGFRCSGKKIRTCERGSFMPEALGSPEDKGLAYYRIQITLSPFFKNRKAVVLSTLEKLT